MISETVNGVHTYSVGTVITHEQFKKIWDACYKTGCIDDSFNIWKKRERLYCSAFQEQGLKVYLTGKCGKLYRLRVQIEPCHVLGEQDPTALFQPDTQSYKKLVKTADKLLKKLKVPVSIDQMKISRCDLTINILFSTQAELMEFLRIFKKSFLIKHYDHVVFQKNGQKAKNWKAANAHSHCLSCKSASFLTYDKIAQLEMIDRCDELLLNKHILRLEAELKRPALKKHLGKAAMATNRGILFAAAEKTPKVVRQYLKRMQPSCTQYLRYEDAVKLIKGRNLKSKTQKRMLYLLRKVSDADSLTNAVGALRYEYSLSSGQCNTILKKFKELGISPITLRNDSEYDKLPALKL